MGIRPQSKYLPARLASGVTYESRSRTIALPLCVLTPRYASPSPSSWQTLWNRTSLLPVSYLSRDGDVCKRDGCNTAVINTRTSALSDVDIRRHPRFTKKKEKNLTNEIFILYNNIWYNEIILYHIYVTTKGFVFRIVCRFQVWKEKYLRQRERERVSPNELDMSASEKIDWFAIVKLTVLDPRSDGGTDGGSPKQLNDVLTGRGRPCDPPPSTHCT